jgi:hypothetical protein
MSISIPARPGCEQYRRRINLSNASDTGGEDVILEESFFNQAPCLTTKKMLP